MWAGAPGGPRQVPSDPATKDAWRRALFDANLALPSWLIRHFESIPVKAAIVADGSADTATRRCAVVALYSIGGATMMLLERLLYFTVAEVGPPSAAFAPLAGRRFLAAAGMAVRSWVSFAWCMARPETRTSLDAGSQFRASKLAVDAAGRCADAAYVGATLARFVCIGGLATLSVGASPAGLPASSVTSAARFLQDLADSDLLPATAAATLRCPLPDVGAAAPPAEAWAVRLDEATQRFVQALAALQLCFRQLGVAGVCGAGGGAAAAEVSKVLGVLMGHDDVNALRHALLERLRVHAGMPLPPAAAQGAGVDPRVGAAGGSGDQTSSSSSSPWWLTRLEAVRGAPVTMADLPPKAGGSGASLKPEDFHVHIAYVTLSYWRGVHLDTANPPSCAPPPRELAQLAAGAAEALCRLCRGQGLRGAYGPSPPTWQAVLTQASALGGWAG
ncbi:hypothetical protein GPECTOR_7g1216 [Gonium pectorale]|uniref:Uncharacterized protein n=1 Tax=Gonium pectorale TaxID=33097 RepID=A0A150GUA9_GONPE|nr:hypothetical protein GPECTOR_7g1216 [Gonium pectorale]|eukprot:KXZ53322.1 hypothetical protein GPECTOR_7g1216 [Gonium pectorale]